MKTIDVKMNGSYLHIDTNEVVTIVEKIPGKETNKRDMHGGIMFVGYKRMQKKFKLSNGYIVKADKLMNI